MDEGFILSNKFRRAIFDELAAGETDIVRITRKHRIINLVAMKIVDEFIKGNIVEKKGSKYILTLEGEKLSKQLR
jgi:hypothetical protein